jgi:hypothetical protein
VIFRGIARDKTQIRRNCLVMGAKARPVAERSAESPSCAAARYGRPRLTTSPLRVEQQRVMQPITRASAVLIRAMPSGPSVVKSSDRCR